MCYPFHSVKVYGADEKEGYTELYVWDLAGNFVKYKDAAYDVYHNQSRKRWQ